MKIEEAMDEEEAQSPSTFMFMGCGEGDRPKWMSFPCPGALGQSHPGTRCLIPIRPQANGVNASWEWDGNRDAPTMSPSVNCANCWHGFIRAGQFVTA